MYVIRNFNPRPPRGGRHSGAKESAKPKKFQSTPSARRATVLVDGNRVVKAISIHALREEGDAFGFHMDDVFQGISIHALREEGDYPISPQRTEFVISIHALREEGDGLRSDTELGIFISIHALREEGDRQPRRNY